MIGKKRPVELNTPFKFDYFRQATKFVDDFGIQYVGIFNKGVFNKWGEYCIALRNAVCKACYWDSIFSTMYES